jgi:hypothetical protein
MEFQLRWGRIYRIRCNITGENYIGSTFKKLKTRFSEHKSACKRKFFKKGPSSSCYNIIMRGDSVIECIWQGYVFSKEHLKKIERTYVETIPCVNKNIPYRTEEEKILFQNNICKHCHNKYY